MRSQVRFLSNPDFILFSRGWNIGLIERKTHINLNPSVHSIRSLPAKLAIPSNPHLFIIALSCTSISESASSNCVFYPAIPRPRENLRSRVSRARLHPTGNGHNSQGVVNICSPVNTAFAPAIKHIICSGSLSFCRPAASRMIVFGSTIRAVAIVRSTLGNGTG